MDSSGRHPDRIDSDEALANTWGWEAAPLAFPLFSGSAENRTPTGFYADSAVVGFAVRARILLDAALEDTAFRTQRDRFADLFFFLLNPDGLSARKDKERFRWLASAAAYRRNSGQSLAIARREIDPVLASAVFILLSELKPYALGMEAGDQYEIESRRARLDMAVPRLATLEAILGLDGHTADFTLLAPGDEWTAWTVRSRRDVPHANDDVAGTDRASDDVPAFRGA